MYKEGVVWDYIFCFNLESKLGLPELSYDYGTLRPALHAAEYALKHDSILVFESNAVSHVPLPKTQLATEDTPYIKPKKGYALAYSLLAEEQLRRIEGLKLIVLRSAIPYGPDFTIGFCTVFVLCRILKDQQKPHYHQFDLNARMRCVHVRDLARAYWHTASVYPTLGKRVCVYNVACPDDFTGNQIWEMVTGYYGVPLKRMNPVMAKVATMVMKIPGTLDRFNQKLVGTWLKLCEEQGVGISPIMAYIDAELLEVNESAVDGSLITRETGFVYEYPKVTLDLLKEGIEQLQQMNLFPY
jgi:nucleoside-diphosphate-sugar epimerase